MGRMLVFDLIPKLYSLLLQICHVFVSLFMFVNAFKVSNQEIRKSKMSSENFFDIAYTIENSEDARKMYDRWAEVYDQDLSGVDYQQPARCADTLLRAAKNTDLSVLDVGCGTGLSGLALKTAGFEQLDGCDISEGMLAKAEKLEIYGRLFACDLNQPPIEAENEQYDAVTAVGVFSFGHIMPDAVDELLRVVKPGGPVIIGLNDHYYEEGSLVGKLASLEKADKISIQSQEHGEHIPGNDLKGWVISLVKQ